MQYDDDDYQSDKLFGYDSHSDDMSSSKDMNGGAGKAGRGKDGRNGNKAR